MSDLNTNQENTVPEELQLPQPEVVISNPIEPTLLPETTDSLDAAPTEEAAVPMMAAKVNSSFIQEFSYDKKERMTGEEALTGNGEKILFPDLDSSSTINNLSVPSARVDDEASRRWLAIIQTATSSTPPSDGLLGVVNRTDAAFHQYLQTERGRVGYSSPKFNDVAGAKLSGDRAMLRVRSLLGQGGLITIPLWHSGFHVTLKTPSESALIETRRRMQNERISLGRYTFGLVFSNTAAYTVNMLMDLVLDHVYETSLKDSSDLRKKIESLDIPVLLWGLACAIWPNGFQYARAITTEEGMKTNEVIGGLIDVAKLMWVDNKAFTPKQKAHMSNRQTGSMTMEQVNSYKEDFPLRAGRLVELYPGISVEFGPPTVEQYVLSGQRWVEKLVQIVEGTLTGDRDDIVGRNNAIIQHGTATVMRQHAHWVKLIKLGEETVEDTDNIELTLETMSESEDVRRAYLTAYNAYVNDVTTAIIGIPEAAPNDLKMPRFPHLIPIDVVSVFFTLLMQRVNLLESR